VSLINPRAKALRHIDRLAQWQAGAKPAPVTVEWDLSNRCSLGCQDCHFAHTHSKGPWTARGRTLPMAFDGTGDLADTQMVLRALTEMRQYQGGAGPHGIVWSGGGEPTLHPSWESIVTHAHVEGFEQGMYTLGGHLDTDSARLLASIAKFVVVSLDAPDPQTYAQEKGVPESRFEQACNGIRMLSAPKKAAIGVSFLLHGRNWGRVGLMLELARELGATYATFRPAIRFHAHHPSIADDDPSWVTRAVPLLEKVSREPDVELDVTKFTQYRDWAGHGYGTCYGIRLNTTITPDGRMWICPNRRGMPGSCLGDLRTESFGAIWARHPASFAVNDQCRVMCRLHPVNEVLHAIEQPRAHEAFV
jgi:MoaA/NifB/PqqE/SkfB family radical SAM enzyme